MSSGVYSQNNIHNVDFYVLIRDYGFSQDLNERISREEIHVFCYIPVII